MRQHVFDGDAGQRRIAAAGQQARERVVERERPALDFAHHQGAGGQHLGQRGEVVNRVVTDSRGAALVGERAAGEPPQHLAIGADLDDGAGKRALLDRAFHDVPGGGEALHGGLRPQRRRAPSGHVGGVDGHRVQSGVEPGWNPQGSRSAVKA